jgi:hypothetical protein
MKPFVSIMPNASIDLAIDRLLQKQERKRKEEGENQELGIKNKGKMMC